MERTVNFWGQFTFERDFESLFRCAWTENTALIINVPCWADCSKVISVIWSLSTVITTAQAYLIDAEFNPYFPFHIL